LLKASYAAGPAATRCTRRPQGLPSLSRIQGNRKAMPATRTTQVEIQDQAVGVARSRTLVAERFDVPEQQVREIEQEGLEGKWPPL